MANNIDVRLLGFADFKASERFLCALHDEISVIRWDISVDRPAGLNTGDAMRAELEQPSLITVVSAHGYLGDPGLGFCGENNGDTSVLMVDTIKNIGAASMLLIDACYFPDLADELKRAARPGSLIVGLDHDPGEEPYTWGRDSVTALAAVIRELCYPVRKDLSPEAVTRAVHSVNAQIEARNGAERNRGVTNAKAMRPLVRIYSC